METGNMVPDVGFDPNATGDKHYFCPNCKVTFDYRDVIDGEAAKRIDGYNRIYQCKQCEHDFRMPE